jgi:hypothetical protein
LKDPAAPKRVCCIWIDNRGRIGHDGERLQVPHPDSVALSQGGRTVVVMAEGENFKVLDLTLVTALEMDSH